uniref:Uncharacterized protein n=1 Tax=Percolomonas cosmopolitus TaxID=63605 RepID=A0A7S1KQS5_9EUKA|eukprot:CAMPEP_0117437472 /NCGR_PEP_ID=MMETSP0759-20121206/1540_1 /TAXON_ID=63605 /ORGANISM="Percolomonas cosmopolitus, Strain WS" /LENGTH=620 /DNA_ID=CAMNT_0005229103 /DNA_START=61 /DNA_END=1923 /DNA_ORIENTATION=+
MNSDCTPKNHTDSTTKNFAPFLQLFAQVGMPAVFNPLDPQYYKIIQILHEINQKDKILQQKDRQIAELGEVPEKKQLDKMQKHKRELQDFDSVKFSIVPQEDLQDAFLSPLEWDNDIMFPTKLIVGIVDDFDLRFKEYFGDIKESETAHEDKLEYYQTRLSLLKIQKFLQMHFSTDVNLLQFLHSLRKRYSVPDHSFDAFADHVYRSVYLRRYTAKQCGLYPHIDIRAHPVLLDDRIYHPLANYPLPLSVINFMRHQVRRKGYETAHDTPLEEVQLYIRFYFDGKSPSGHADLPRGIVDTPQDNFALCHEYFHIAFVRDWLENDAPLTEEDLVRKGFWLKLEVYCDSNCFAFCLEQEIDGNDHRSSNSFVSFSHSLLKRCPLPPPVNRHFHAHDENQCALFLEKWYESLKYPLFDLPEGATRGRVENVRKIALVEFKHVWKKAQKPTQAHELNHLLCAHQNFCRIKREELMAKSRGCPDGIDKTSYLVFPTDTHGTYFVPKGVVFPRYANIFPYGTIWVGEESGFFMSYQEDGLFLCRRVAHNKGDGMDVTDCSDGTQQKYCGEDAHNIANFFGGFQAYIGMSYHHPLTEMILPVHMKRYLATMRDVKAEVLGGDIWVSL